LEKFDRKATDNTIWCTHFECWITKATHPRSQYIIFISFARQQWLCERASMLLYTYICLSWATKLRTSVLITNFIRFEFQNKKQVGKIRLPECHLYSLETQIGICVGKLVNFLYGAKQLTATSSLTLRTARTWAKDIDPYVKEPYLRHSTANSEETTTYFTINTPHFGR
jgi:hypothetical protein